MIKSVLVDTDERELFSLNLPFIPDIGEHIAIDREDYFKYYFVVERWITIDAKNNALVYLTVEQRD